MCGGGAARGKEEGEEKRAMKIGESRAQVIIKKTTQKKEEKRTLLDLLGISIL